MADIRPAATDERQAWRAVRLTEAQQVHALIGTDPDERPAPDLAVCDGYRMLRDGGSPVQAMHYLAHALPRLEAVGWAAQVLQSADAGHAASPRARHALDTALRWLGERTEAHRRAAREAGEELGKPVAERYLCQAVFYSGGSIAAPDHAPVMPPDNAAARYVAAAISQAVNRSADPADALSRALRQGERIAERGLSDLDA